MAEYVVLYPGQCCPGYCVDDLLHDLRRDQADRLVEVLAEVARQAEARALREAADQLTEIADDYDTRSELHAALRECDLDTAHWLRARADQNEQAHTANTEWSES